MLPARMKSSLRFLMHSIVPAAICFGIAWLLMRSPWLQRIENITLDIRTRFRANFVLATPSDELALIGIDETSLRKNGHWPWNREFHGTMLQLLSRRQPAVVSWDILFSEPTDADEYLAKSIAMNRSVILGAAQMEDLENGLTPEAARAAGVRVTALPNVVGDRTRILTTPAMSAPTPTLARVAEAAFVDTPPGDDGLRRTVPLIVRVGDQVYPTLGLRTLMEYWRATPSQVTVRLGEAVVIDAPQAKRRIPIDEAGAYAINYRHKWVSDSGKEDGFVSYGYSDVQGRLALRYANNDLTVSLPGLTGRMLLIGQVADGLADLGPTPFSSLTPLVLVHANVIENVLQEDYLRFPSMALVWIGGFVVGVAGLARFSQRKPIEQAIFAIGMPIAFIIAAILLWFNGSWVVPVVGPLIGFGSLQVYMIGRRMLAELQAKEQIKGMFGTYVSPEVVNRLVAAGKPPELGGHEAEITAYFSDIQDFSTISEILPPPGLVELMNEYLTVCTDIIQGEGGALDKYIGDAVVAMFGAPVPMADHAYRACVAVVRAQQALDGLRAKWKTDGHWPEIVWRMRSRIGLNTGPCVIGNMGSRTRFNYTMMGDNVNLAARMESGAKSWGVFTMCTESTRGACEAHANGRVIFRPLGRIQVKGRSAAVPIHEIAGLRESFPDQGRECIALFSQALERYYEQDWEGATTLFRRSAQLELLTPENSPGVRNTPSLVYIDIIARQRDEPRHADWDGVYVMKEK
jgi:adenylate cyclase